MGIYKLDQPRVCLCGCSSIRDFDFRTAICGTIVWLPCGANAAWSCAGVCTGVLSRTPWSDKVEFTEKEKKTEKRKAFVSSRYCGQLRLLDVSFSYVCPVVDHKFRHNIVKVAVDPRAESRVDLQSLPSPCAPLLTVKISQWARDNFCCYCIKEIDNTMI